MSDKLSILNEICYVEEVNGFDTLTLTEVGQCLWMEAEQVTKTMMLDVKQVTFADHVITFQRIPRRIFDSSIPDTYEITINKVEKPKVLYGEDEEKIGILNRIINWFKRR